MAYIKTRVEQGVGCKVQVCVPEAGKQGPFTQNLPWGALIPVASLKNVTEGGEILDNVAS